jgi:hypothetical protein
MEARFNLRDECEYSTYNMLCSVGVRMFGSIVLVDLAF